MTNFVALVIPNGMHAQEALLPVVVLSALAGAVHVLAPDHWVPTTMLSWRKRWRMGRTLLFSLVSLLIHVGLGFAIYLGFHDFVAAIDHTRLFIFTLTLISTTALIRGLRFPRVSEVLQGGQNSLWGFWAVFTLLGPCESIIPVLIKARHLGIGYLVPFGAFLGGTFIVGASLALLGRLVCDRPFWLTRGMYWVRRRIASLPVATGLAVGLTYLLRLS